jgi:ribosomal protein S18 acetylase RimI-like enzyme
MDAPITRRKVTVQDRNFLFELFKAVRAGDFASLPLAPAQLNALMQIQFQGQTGGYTAEFPDADHEIVMLGDDPVGRLWVNRSGTAIVLVDISLVPSVQNRGLGTRLLSALIAESAEAGVPLRCSVAVSNPGSLRFHQRLGFTIVDQDEVYYQLERAPAAPMQAFDQFRDLVFSDPALLRQLRQAPDLPALMAMVIAAAGERGLQLSEADLQAAVNANRRSWFERWVHQ